MKHLYKKKTAAVISILGITVAAFCIISLTLKNSGSTNHSLLQTDFEGGECTIGVASGSATPDGRPMIWKTGDRDNYHSGLYYNTNMRYYFTGEILSNNPDLVWIGINEKGFAVANSLDSRLSIAGSGMTNGVLIKYALGNCSTIEEFERVLDSTNTIGRQTRGNFVVLDATGGAKVIEADGWNYWVYDANKESDAPDGYIIRTNFTNASGGNDGIERFQRSQQLISDFSSGDSLCCKSILRYQMRDFSSINGEPRLFPFDSTLYPESPHGYYHPFYSICRDIAKSAFVVQGVLENEDPRLSTMWTMLGQPAASIVVPFWPVGNVPIELRSNQISSMFTELTWKIKEEIFDPFFIEQFNMEFELIDSYKILDGSGGGLWTMTFPLEDTIIQRAEKQLDIWRNSELDERQIMTYNAELANFAYNELEKIYNKMIGASSIDNGNLLSQNLTISSIYPNPSSGITNIELVLNEETELSIQIFNSSGQEVKVLNQNQLFQSGTHIIEWNGDNENQNYVPQGIYFIVLSSEKERISKTCLRI